jgi:hypothetical protein
MFLSDEVVIWAVLALAGIGATTLLALGLWVLIGLVRLPVRLFRKSRDQRLIEELLTRNHQAAQTYLTELLKETDAHVYARRAVNRLHAGRSDDGHADPPEGSHPGP